MNLLKELEKDPFEPDDFVERLARHTIQVQGGATKGFGIGLLHETFTKIIGELQGLQELQKKKCEQLEVQYKDEESKDLQKVALLQERNKGAVLMFHELDERINYVAAKVIHLGDQLESVNVPRSKAVEAQRLMRHFQDFHVPGSFLDDVFTDSSRISEAADIIQKLNSIAMELPEDKFGDAKRKIAAKYDEVERYLIEGFRLATQSDDVASMKQLANLLCHFKGYSQCVDAFIEISQSGALTGADVFRDVIPLCERNYELVKHVFPNPEQVMAKFVLNFFSLKLQNCARAKLDDKSDTGKYLRTLHDLYVNTVKTSEAMSHFDMGSDETYLQKLTMRVFQRELEDYIKMEVKFLRDRCMSALKQYYDSKNHQKKQIQTDSSRFQDFRRDLQAVIGTRTNINIAQIEDYRGETFISEELATSILQSSKACFQRCQVLSKPSELASNAVALLETLLQHLLVEHVDYALELGLQSVPIPETKTFPQTYFFDVVRCTNAIVHLMEKLYAESVIPLVISTPEYTDCIAKERYILETIENKLDGGLDRTVNAIVGWVKIFLQTEQRKADLKPETEKKETLPSPACLTVVQNISVACGRIRESLDSRNAEAVLTELGVRFHRVILDHLSQYTYNTSEAVYVVCDVIEYKKCAVEMKVPLVVTLFDTLQALWNLLLVRPENLKQVCTDGQLAELDESVLFNFIQLRSDCKTQKLGGFLKGISA